MDEWLWAARFFKRAGRVHSANADIPLVGHMHLPFVRQFRSYEVVNPGSLGQPRTGRPSACYALQDGRAIELRSGDYPFEETIRKLDALPVEAQ